MDELGVAALVLTGLGVGGRSHGPAEPTRARLEPAELDRVIGGGRTAERYAGGHRGRGPDPPQHL
jgi:hypothetical protein